jgi:DNA polymerase
MARRGQWQALADGTRALATVHPSWVLRQRGETDAASAYRGFVDDLRTLAQDPDTPRAVVAPVPR